MAIWNQRIREKRLSNQMTLAQVADKIGVTEATAQRYESGKIKSIPYDLIGKYGHIFGVTPAYFFGWETTLSHPPLLVSESFQSADISYLVEDDALSGSRIKKGDCVFIKKNAEIRDGDIVMIRVARQNMLRRVRIAKDPQSMVFYGDGEHTEEITMYDSQFQSDPNHVQIIGRAMGFQSVFK